VIIALLALITLVYPTIITPAHHTLDLKALTKQHHASIHLLSPTESGRHIIAACIKHVSTPDGRPTGVYTAYRIATNAPHTFSEATQVSVTPIRSCQNGSDSTVFTSLPATVSAVFPEETVTVDNAFFHNLGSRLVPSHEQEVVAHVAGTKIASAQRENVGTIVFHQPNTESVS